MTDPDLRELARRCGIADEYWDVRGGRRATTDDTRRDLLAAMHLPVRDCAPREIQRALEDAEWHKPLPAVLVVRAGEPPGIALALPADLEARAWRWSLHQEGAQSRGSAFVPATLSQIGQRVLASPGFWNLHDPSQFSRRRILLPGMTLTGYHRFEVEAPGGERDAMTIVVVPETCYLPDAIRHDGRVWGPAVQAYGLRSHRNWGIGDFTDLRNLVDLAADTGGGIVGVSPLHQLFPDDPTRISPYRPSSRAALNTAFLDVEALPEFAANEAAQALVAAPAFQARLRSLRAGEYVDYAAVAAAKREVLDLLWRGFRDRELAHDTPRARAFATFRAQAGAPIERLARFEALQAHFRARDASIRGWPAWPAQYRDPDAAPVTEFATAHADEVSFHAWLQWCADEQLGDAGRRSWHRGLGIGLYADLAAGVDPDGADAWGWQGVFAAGAHLGAPADEFNAHGQDWGLPPFVPHRLRGASYAPFVEMLRANMKHSGALRIDHVMGLMRLFWIPAGRPAADGAYVSYPFDDLLGILALESRRNHCMVVGEDLGTVPEGLRPRLAAADLLACRPLLFQREPDGGFTPPAGFERKALVAAGTHDLPTLAGLWQGRDIDRRIELGLFPDDSLRQRSVVERAQDRARLLVALERAHVLPPGTGIDPVAVPVLSPELVVAVHAYLARTPCSVMALQPEDITGQIEQANLPGSTDDRHPNWRRRLPLDIEDWRGDARFIAVFEALRAERGSAVSPHGAAYGAPVSQRIAVIPRATYRIQFNRDFRFNDATAIVPYLAQLGISHIYASPYLKARPGSSHGYDIVDHGAINPEIGSEADYARFVATLREHAMGQILDIVPNHMGVMGADNAWWLDVLENGPASAHAGYFDIDWDPLNPDLKGKVLLPILGDHYGTILERGELRLGFDGGHGEFSLHYWHHRLPVDPVTYPRIVGRHAGRPVDLPGEQDPAWTEMESLITAFARLPPRLDSDPLHAGERQRDKEVLKRRLAALYAESPDLRRRLDEALDEFNGRPGDAASFDLLHDLIGAQGYRLAWWRVAADEINYRRFFDINDLAALRTEDATVFDATHGYVMDRVRMGQIDGLRVDHPDGLYDPGEYFIRLQERAAGRPLNPREPLALYLMVEKILAEHEQLPGDWPIHGATGYRFANLANNLLVDGAGERRMTRAYAEFIGEKTDFDALAHDARKLIMTTSLASELAVLASSLSRIAAADRDTCDYTLNCLKDAIAEVVACFPVYRTYVGRSGASAADCTHIDWAVAVAGRRRPDIDARVLGFLRDVLTTAIAQGRAESYRAAVIAFAMKFQQFTSPVMAKGLEDTAFYRYHRLVSLNDVGADPRRFGVSVAAYHAATRERMKRWPHNVLATSTHDSKRGEDTRCRLDVLSELPAQWKVMVKRWSRMNRSRKRVIDGRPCPTSNDEYLLYQTLVGTWPLEPDADLAGYAERVVEYMTKAVREAKQNSSWIGIDARYEEALAGFVRALLAPADRNLFLPDFVPFAQRIAHHGLLNSLSLALLKHTSPGIPDTYQGCELWQFTLVDPDNRRPVDYGLRMRLSAAIDTFDLDSPLADPRHKLHLIRRILALRSELPALFRDGTYLPLETTGKRSAHACAFMRRQDGQAIVVIAPRLTYRLLGDAGGLPVGTPVWQDTAIGLPHGVAGRACRDVLTGTTFAAGSELPLAQALARYPVALIRVG
ncbi:MAG: malto-oligosyltrehalose synthase [Gammaproteobacteria bacterium]